MFRCTLLLIGLQLTLLLAYDFPPSAQIASILRNDRLLKSYHHCLIDKAPCTAEGTRLKSTYKHYFLIKLDEAFGRYIYLK